MLISGRKLENVRVKKYLRQVKLKHLCGNRSVKNTSKQSDVLFITHTV